MPSDKNDAEIRRLKALGWADLKIAGHVGSNESYIRERRRALGIPGCPRNAPKPSSGNSLAKTATRIHAPEIRRLHGLCFSDAQIADKIGISRNVVVGFRYRQDLRANNSSADGSRIRDGHRRRFKKANKAVDTIVYERPAYRGDGPNGGCRYPHGDPGSPGFRWCGKPRTHASYCDEHHKLCHQPRPDRLANKLRLVPAIWVGEADGE